jgi:glutamyl-tRNA reductase
MTRNQPPRIDGPAGPDRQPDAAHLPRASGREGTPGAPPAADRNGASTADRNGASTVDHGTSTVDRAVPRSLRRLTCLSVTHRSHSIERVGALAPADPVETAREIKAADRVTEAMVLATCNRVEVYVSTRTPSRGDREAATDTVAEILGLEGEPRRYTGLAVAAHIARVAAGLESAVLGEVEIAGQVSDALAAAKDEGLAGGVLGRVGNAALRAARTVRTETDIDEGPTGYGSAVCREIADERGGSPDHVLLIGAGDIARTVATAVERRWDARVDVANRSPAPDLPTADGSSWPLSALEDAIEDVDAVVSATGADEPVLDRATVDSATVDGRNANSATVDGGNADSATEDRAASPERADPLTVVDLGTPPDVSAAAREHPALAVSDVEDLATVLEEASDRRREAVAAAETHIDEALDRLVASERENRAEDVIRDLHREAAAIREAELDRAKRRLAEGEADAETVLEDFASALSGRLLAAPTDELRTAARERDETALRAARRLFDLSGGAHE